MDDSTQDIKAKAFKVIIVGPQAVGKSSILYRLSQSTFNPNYLSTIGIDFKTYNSKVGQHSYSLQIWDTAGQQKFRSLTSTYYKGSQGCICVYDLSTPQTLQKCQYYINKALQENIPKQCIYLIGNKSDLQGISTDKGEQLAKKLDINFDITSAKNGTKIKQIFDQLSEQLVAKFGAISGDERSEIKPKVNFNQNQKKCCGSA